MSMGMQCKEELPSSNVSQLATCVQCSTNYVHYDICKYGKNISIFQQRPGPPIRHYLPRLQILKHVAQLLQVVLRLAKMNPTFGW